MTTWKTHSGGVSSGRISTRHGRHPAHLLGNHPQLLEVHQTVHARVVAEVDESQVLLYQRKERYLHAEIKETAVSLGRQ